MTRCRSLAIVVLFGAAVSFGCASNKKTEPSTPTPATKPAALQPTKAEPTTAPAPKTATAKPAPARSAAKAKPAAAPAKPAAKPSAKAPATGNVASTKPATRFVPTKTTSKAPAKTVAAAPKAKVKAKASEPTGPHGMVLGLGAGDSLGKAVYVNDVIIAARAAKGQTEFAEVQPKEGDN